MDDEMGYGNFPWVITENQSQIPVWESQVKEKISSKSTSAEGTSAFWAYFLLSRVTLREEFGSDFLWSRMGNFHTPRVIRWGIAFLYSKRNRAWTLDHWEPSSLPVGNDQLYMLVNKYQDESTANEVTYDLPSLVANQLKKLLSVWQLLLVF